MRRVSMMRFSTFFFLSFSEESFDFLSKTLNFSVLCVSLFKIQKRETLSTRNARALFLARLVRGVRASSFEERRPKQQKSFFR